MPDITALANAIINTYVNDPEVKAEVDDSCEFFRALIYTTGVIENPDKIDGSDFYLSIVDELENLLC